MPKVRFTGYKYTYIYVRSRFMERGMLNPPLFIKSIHPKQVIVVSNKAFKLPAASQTINKIPSVLQLSLFYPSSPLFFFDGEFLSQS